MFSTEFSTHVENIRGICNIFSTKFSTHVDKSSENRVVFLEKETDFSTGVEKSVEKVRFTIEQLFGFTLWIYTYELSENGVRRENRKQYCYDIPLDNAHEELLGKAWDIEHPEEPARIEELEEHVRIYRRDG